MVTVAHVFAVDEYLSHSPDAAGPDACEYKEVPYTAVLWPASTAAFGIVARTAHASPGVGAAVDGDAVDGAAVEGVTVEGAAVGNSDSAGVAS